MNKIQYISYFKLKGVEEIPKGKSMADVIRQLGEPTLGDMVEVNYMSMQYCIKESDSLKEEIEKLKQTIASMEKDCEWLSCLKAAGIDNWEGCEYAEELLNSRK